MQTQNSMFSDFDCNDCCYDCSSCPKKGDEKIDDVFDERDYIINHSNDI